MIADMVDTRLIAELRTVVEDLTEALASSRERTRQAIDAAAVLQARNVQLEEQVAQLGVEVEALRCGDQAAYADGELTPARAAAFALHLERCEGCRNDLAVNAKMDALLREAARLPL